MTTKDQERGALAKIRKIIADLGVNSYLGSAFDGAFELAEQNIDDDAACTTKYYINKCNEAEQVVNEHHATVSNQSSIIKNLNSHIASLERDLTAANGKIQACKDDRDDYEQALERAKDGLKTRDAEIMALKAKLYDLMMIGAWHAT